jgi:flagellar motility protein MotE (MotC chaperone)
MSGPRRKAGRGTLFILATVLAASGALRVGTLVGAAMAESASPKAVENCPPPPAAVAAALTGREAELKRQEQSIADRMAALTLADQAINKRMTELQSAEDELKKTLSIADGAAEKDLARLTSVYEAMKPAEAAALFQTMAPEFAAGFLGRMRPEIAAAVLAGMKPDKAYSISVLIAGRNATAPKN